ncbi:MAG: DUF503 domain-containing protein [Clostridia bacterium]|nr:DUF503 domain-containing protein [Clostridia bacterium]
MMIAAVTFKLRAPWVHSLKEKRMIVQSLIVKLQNRFHVSAAEIDEQDIHQLIVIGTAAVVPHQALADSLMDEIFQFIEENTDAEVLDEIREIR